MVASQYVPTAQDVGKSDNNVYRMRDAEQKQEGSDQAYSDDDDTAAKDDDDGEESKEFAERKRELQDTNLNNSDDQAYTESDQDSNKSDYRSDDDFEFTSQDSEERNKAFYGDDYTILS